MKSFDRKLGTGISFIIVMVLPLFAGAWLSLRQIIADQNELLSTYTQELLLAKDLRLDVTQARAAMPAYVFSGDESLLKHFDSANRNFAVHLTELSRLIAERDEQKILKQIASFQADMERMARPGIALRRAGKSVDEVHRYFQSHTHQRGFDLDRALGDFTAHTSAAFEEAKAESRRESQRIVNGLAVASTLILFFCLITAGLIMLMVRRKKAHDETNDRLYRRERELSLARKETVEVVAHDLKGPLASIMMSTEFAIADFAPSPELQQSLEITLRSAQSMKRLIDDLLDHAKIESDSLALNRADCSLEDLIRELADRFRPIAEAKGVTLAVNAPPALPKICVDEGRIEQVISNILGNSIKFTSRGGQIDLAIEMHGHDLELSVSDDGCGMTTDQVLHVFERYWQVRGNAAAQGNGLGLAISKAIIEAHHGRIRVCSQVGRGTSFTVSLPMGDAALPPALAAEPRRKTVPGLYSTMTA